MRALCFAERQRVLPPLGAERVEVRGLAALVVGGRVDVVVAGERAVREAAPVARLERLADARELAGLAVLDVAEVGERDNVVNLVVEHVLERRVDGRGIPAVLVEQVRSRCRA
ncbi:hypothetical protein [Amycolatopsis sp. NPDC051903]|uniref:hypothetical protein n=1 Tax=Amycolatopsis sp. NPDC051903 TaxID=3363936 RepID=UPI00378AB923